jgi:uncharacterized membrane protein YqjE
MNDRLPRVYRVIWHLNCCAYLCRKVATCASVTVELVATSVDLTIIETENDKQNLAVLLHVRTSLNLHQILVKSGKRTTVVILAVVGGTRRHREVYLNYDWETGDGGVY